MRDVTAIREPATAGVARYDPPATAESKAHRLIPGGCHTYAKGDDQYPEAAPPVIARGSGCHVWDLHGNEYIEYGMGLRSVTLGHAHPAVTDAVCEAIRLGTNFTRPTPIEVECAEGLLQMVRGDMVKFAKNGSDATSAAVRLARAATGRDTVAICGDQPFFSVDDWFIGSTPMNAGVPQAIRRLTVAFRYNDVASLETVFREHSGQIACVVMEAATAIEPLDDFLHHVQRLCRREGALFVLDEMITGFRWHNGGAQAVYDIQPDLATFGKAMGNGFSSSALVGRRDIMQLGGLITRRDRVFLLSTTHGAETTGLAAALATMRVFRTEPVIQTMYERGTRLREGIMHVVDHLGLRGLFSVEGRPSNLIYVTRDADGNRSQVMRTLFMQEIIRRGVLGPSFVISYSHSNADVDQTIDAVAGALEVYRRALDSDPESFIEGKPVRPVFRRRN